MARVLFLVHGMGVHGADWSTPVRDTLVGLAAQYDRFKTSPLTDAVDIVPITYDTVFTDQLARWQAAADDLRGFTQGQGISLGPGADVFGWLSRASEIEGNFFWSHVVDVLLYRYVQDVTKQVRLSVMRDMAKALADRWGRSTPQATVLAHSLGTAVAHDSLHLLGSIPLGGSETFLSKNFTFKSLITLANVSRVLQTAPGPYESVVFPRTRARKEGYLRRYYDFRHVVDPIPSVRPFTPVGWAAKLVAEAGLDFFRGFNVHGFEHYLDSPAVHIPILNAVVPRAISDEEAAEARASYARVDGIDCAAELDAFVTRARQILSLAQDTRDPKRLVVAGAQFLAAAKEAHDAC